MKIALNFVLPNISSICRHVFGQQNAQRRSFNKVLGTYTDT